MPFELEALVGQLYIAGGKTINTTPPGALVEVAPAKAVRGRETDTFFALVLPSGAVAPTSFYEQMALMSAERYFSTTGSVTSVLRETLNKLNHNLYQHNISNQRLYEAHILCAVMRGKELYVARTGAGVAVLRTGDDEVQTYPIDINDDEALFLPPMGVQPIPVVEMKRFKLQQHTRLLLVDANLAEITQERIVAAINAPTLENVLDEFKTLVTLQTQMMAIEFVPPEETVAVPVAVGESTADISAEIAAARARVRAKTEAEAPPIPEELLKHKQSNRIVRSLRRTVAWLTRQFGHAVDAIGQLLAKLTGGEPNPQRRKLSAGAIITVVLALPLVLVGIVMVLWVSGVSGSAFDQCVSRSLAAVDTARSIESSNPSSVIAAWQGVLASVNSCEEIRPGDPTMNALFLEAQGVIDRLSNVQRRQAVVLDVLPNATITRLVLQGLDLYALDGANNRVQRIQLTSDGRQVANNEYVVNMRQGALVDGLTVGEIIDIDYDTQNNFIVALDENGVLVRCLPRFINQCEAQRLLNAENWRNSIAMITWLGRVYVLDIGVDQIWRYEPSGSTYVEAPSEYFTGTNRRSLASAVDFDISTSGNTNGSVYILYSDGVMSRHFGGEALDFRFSGFPVGQEFSEINSVQRLYLNDSTVLPAMYFVSRPTRTVYETGLSGTYFNTYRIFNENNFERLSAVAVDDGQQMLYAASGNTVFSLSMQG